MNVFEKFYDSIFSVLSNDVTITTLVPVQNIQPSHDPTEQVAGASIIYGWQSSSWDAKRRRGTGNLYAKISSPDNKVQAQVIFERFREIVTAVALTNTDIRVHLFSELAFRSDMDGVNEQGKFVVSTQYLVKLIEA